MVKILKIEYGFNYVYSQVGLPCLYAACVTLRNSLKNHLICYKSFNFKSVACWCIRNRFLLNVRYVTKTLDTMNINIIKCVTCASQWRNRVATHQRAVTPADSYCQHLLFYSGFVIDYFKWSVQTIYVSNTFKPSFYTNNTIFQNSSEFKAYLLSLVCNFDFFDKSHW